MRTNIPVVVLLLNLFPLAAAGQEGKSLPLKTRTDTIIVYDTLYIHDTIKIEKPLPSIREYVRRVSAEVNNKNILPAFLADSGATFSSSGILLSNKQSTMKRKTLLGITFALFLQALQAQSEFGVQAGLVLWKDVSTYQAIDPAYSSGVSGGVYYKLAITNKLSVSAGVMYQHLTAPRDSAAPFLNASHLNLVKSYYRTGFNVLKLPVRLHFNSGKLSPFIGIAYNLKTAANKMTDSLFTDQSGRQVKDEYSLHMKYLEGLAGIQYKINKNIGFSATYYVGIKNPTGTYKGSKNTVTGETTVSPHPTSFEFSIIYSFSKKNLLPFSKKKK
ncbi:MAG: outer membrane beta-barrel protein [Chitinophagaceae bacterium]